MFSNFLTAIASGTGITLALFYVMQALISLQPAVASVPRDPTLLPWVRIPPPEEQPISPWERKPERIDDPPPLPEPVDHETGSEQTLAVPGAAPAGPSGPGTAITFGMSDGVLVNMIRTRPVYPAAAIARELEGHVIVQFDVMANGTVTNVTVIESSDRIFEKSAKDAAKRFRYRARVIDGVPEPTYGVRYRFRYRME